MKSIGSEDFFKQVAINSAVSDLSLVKNIYYGMIRTVGRELKNRHVVRLPDWGDFLLKIQKSRNTLNVNTGRQEVIPPKPMVKFIPAKAVKKHFYAIGGESTVIK